MAAALGRPPHSRGRPDSTGHYLSQNTAVCLKQMPSFLGVLLHFKPLSGTNKGATTGQAEVLNRFQWIQRIQVNREFFLYTAESKCNFSLVRLNLIAGFPLTAPLNLNWERIGTQ